MQRCLVLGGDGFLGSHIVEELLKRGFKVRVFGRFQDKKVKNLNHVKSDIELFAGDFLKKTDLINAIEGIDYVFNFIALSNPISTFNKPLEEIQTNLPTTINLLEICATHAVKKLIFPSSGGSIYGDSNKKYASEEDHLNPISPHAISKICIENYLHYYFNRNNLDYLIYRMSNVYGERQNPKSVQGIVPITINKALHNQEINIYGNTTRDYIYVKDVTNFIADNFDKKHKWKIYNLGSGQGTTLNHLLQLIQKVTHLNLKINKLGRRKSDVRRIVLNIDRAKSEFSFKPKTSLEKGLKMTFNWFNEKNKKNEFE